MLYKWQAAANALRKGEITQESCDQWRYNFPDDDTTRRWVKVPSQGLMDDLVAGLQKKSDSHHDCCQIVATRGFGRSETLILRRLPDFSLYSHSMEAGGLLVTSSTTRLACGTSFTIREEMVATRSYGKRAQSAVIKSSVVTALRAMV